MQVRIDLDAVRTNAERLARRLPGDLVGVVKGVDAREPVVDALLAAGVDSIAVSRVAHLRRLADADAEVVMLRIPALSELSAVVSLADVTLHGSPAVVEAAAAEARSQGTTHAVVAMVDAGDGREGVPPEEAPAFVETIERLDGLELRAVGVNLGCFGDLPDPVDVEPVAEAFPGYPLSVGGSGLVPNAGELPDSVDRFRVGDALLTGKWEDVPIQGLEAGAVVLEAEVLASRADEALVDLGSVTTDPGSLIPLEDVSIERWSSDQAVISPSRPEGEIVAFEMEYDALAATFSSRYL